MSAQHSAAWENLIHLAVSPWDLTDDYNRHCGVTIASFLENCHGEKVVVHILCEEVLNQNNSGGMQENKEKYQILCDNYGADLMYHVVELPDWVDEMPAIRTFTRGTLLRLYLQDILPNIEKVIYLDCDIVVNTDVRQLWGIDIENVPLAASYEIGIEQVILSRGFEDTYWEMTKTSPDRYFNAGVLILNLAYLRKMGGVSDLFFEYLRNNRDTPYLDQDALNYPQLFI